MKTNFERILSKIEGGGGQRPPVLEIQRLTQEDFVIQFDRIAASGVPVIYEAKAGLKSIKALGEAIGEYPLKLRTQKFESTGKYNPLNREYTESTVAQYVDSIQQGTSSNYAGNILFTGDSNEVFGVEFPPVVPAESLRQPSIWLGPEGCVTPLHRDSADNFAVHVFGTKRWTLFPPEQAPYLGIISMEGLPSTGGEFAISGIDVENPDLEAYPEFAKAVPTKVDLHSGEALFLPAGWHHHVRTLETALMLNYWVEDAELSPAFLGR